MAINNQTKKRRILLAGLCMLISTTTRASTMADPLLASVSVDQLEIIDAHNQTPWVFDGMAWLGYDLNKLWLKAKVEHSQGRTEEAELQALYGKAIAPFWDLQLGVRHDFRPTPSRNWGVIGLQGVAPYQFEVDTALFIGESGRTALRLQAEYELLFTQRLILSPEIEINAYGQNDEASGTGSGISYGEFGLRLRYEIIRKFAPYIGITQYKKWGNTADLAQQNKQDASETQLVLGIRAWL